MIKKYILVFILCLPLLVRAESGSETPTDLARLLALDLAALGNVQVYTASRSLTDIDKAPSVVTLITRDQIERHGYQNLRDVLQRVPGFHISSQLWGDAVYNRGYPGDIEGYLLLIDGHSQNLRYIFGMQNLHSWPLLSEVERIEITRGPGATLWGTEALQGIIHIFTRNGADLDDGSSAMGTTRAKVSYEFTDQRRLANLLWGKDFDKDRDLMVSLSYIDADPDWLEIYQPGATEPVVEGWPSAHRDFNPSYNMQMKGRWDDFTLTGRLASLDAVDANNTRTDGSQEGNWDWRQAYLDLKYQAELSDKWDVEVTAYYERNSLFRSARFSDPAATWAVIERDYESFDYGLEAIPRYHFGNASQLLLGVSYRYVEPTNVDSRRVDPQGNVGFFPMTIDTPESTIALFSEVTYGEIENWTLIAGVRWDKETRRFDESKLLPRFSAIYTINPQWSVKYAHNTGYVRASAFYDKGPGFVYGNGNLAAGPAKGATQKSNDLQFSYRNDNTSASATLFYSTVKDRMVGANFLLIDGVKHTTYGNVEGDVVSKGIELEFTRKLDDHWDIYGNYTYAKAKLDKLFQTIGTELGPTTFDYTGDRFVTLDRELTGVPHNIWHFGVDWQVKPGLTANLHYRGFSDTWVKWSNAPEYKKLGIEYFIDANIRWENVAGVKNLTMSTYVNNLFDNDHIDPNGAWTGNTYTTSAGRKIALDLIYRF